MYITGVIGTVSGNITAAILAAGIFTAQNFRCSDISPSQILAVSVKYPHASTYLKYNKKLEINVFSSLY